MGASLLHFKMRFYKHFTISWCRILRGALYTVTMHQATDICKKGDHLE